jgi:hypothetical protein
MGIHIRFQWAKKGRLVAHFCVYTNILDAVVEMDVLGIECESLDFTEVAKYRFQ